MTDDNETLTERDIERIRKIVREELDLGTDVDRLMKLSDAAEYLAISLRALHDLIAAGDLQPIRILPRAPRLSKRQLDTFIRFRALRKNR